LELTTSVSGFGSGYFDLVKILIFKLLRSFFSAALLLIMFGISARGKAVPEIRWMSIEDAVNTSLVTPKKLFIYIYSDHCGWCRRMNDISFKDTVIINYLNNNFYPVKLNTELSRDVTLGARIYKYIPADPSSGSPSHHELVVTLLNGRLAYPAMSFISEKMEYMGVEFGYKDPENLEAWLHFIAGNEYLKTPDFETFKKSFSGKI
jgi:thioredoxin-related protein